ncbi:hypothetical protein ARMSODRAFT_946491 [Armillaria solidipes]|uniref:Uncharacterized protein n=1 Tax=Armillaria solidipes TaxID=1076256 RepID=A0A2H3CLJ6_9AGAR|nr:hypothetical protein ARMSODRAFT_946491 [Armillaria solidipes]
MHVLQLIDDRQLHTQSPLFCDGTKVQEELQHLSKREIAESMCTIPVYGNHLPPHIYLESNMVLHLLCSVMWSLWRALTRGFASVSFHSWTDVTLEWDGIRPFNRYRNVLH